jgi:hypothetical protein
MAAHPRLTLAAFGVLWFAVYLIQCWHWPFAACWMCKGNPRKHQNSRRKAWRYCRWCKRTGERLRIGRRIWAYFAKSRQRATRATKGTRR